MIEGDPYRASRVAAALKTSALRFVESLGSEQRAVAMFPFGEDERFFWHYTPIERRGLPLKDMDGLQRGLAYELLAAGLSPRGLDQARAIIDHELILGRIEREAGTVRWDRNPELYYFTIFGDPTGDAPWGCRVDGHHLSLHRTVVQGELVSAAPTFFGANPARVQDGPGEGLRILAATEELARQLVRSLDAPQRGEAIVSETAPADILTTNTRQAKVDGFEGLPVSSMSDEQRETMRRLLREYAERLPDEIAGREMGRLDEGGLEQLRFAWAGVLEPGQGHYYRIQGPTLLIEYDNTQNGANHIHSVWRDLENDFGVDLLRLHYETQHAA